ncbi:hypothetical protein SOASR031_01050 [Leminorella grimontii]|nr:hypothetical protein SOASR031_01050 [Leminorella grimontii]
MASGGAVIAKPDVNSARLNKVKRIFVRIWDDLNKRRNIERKRSARKIINLYWRYGQGIYALFLPFRSDYL